MLYTQADAHTAALIFHLTFGTQQIPKIATTSRHSNTVQLVLRRKRYRTLQRSPTSPVSKPQAIMVNVTSKAARDIKQLVLSLEESSVPFGFLRL